MFREILTRPQQSLLELLSRIAEVRTFYLGGGTALGAPPGPSALPGLRFPPRQGVPATGPALSLARRRGRNRPPGGGGDAHRHARRRSHEFFHYGYPMLRPLVDSPWNVFSLIPMTSRR